MDLPKPFILTQHFQKFYQSEKAGGVVLIACTILSLFLANSTVADSYLHFWHLHADASKIAPALNLPVEAWINDGLMTVFFLLVGLEIERELYVGEFSDFRNAMLPILAAVGGMAVPALIHYYFNHNAPTQQGIGIPMATDIAFSLGMLSLAGNRIPPALKIFLTALAIIDDLGAVIIIAVFYTKNFSFFYLCVALAIFALLLVFNRLKIYRLVFYLVPGVLLWYFMMRSGVHATVSGVMLAFAVPFTKDDSSNPSYKLQHALHMPVNFVIIPIFALANTGIPIKDGWIDGMLSKNSLGIFFGLLLGKPLGILLMCYLAVKLKWSTLPENVGWKLLAGAGVLAGIGFTMSIFITNLAFNDVELVDMSKIVVLAASMVAAIAGVLLLKIFLAGSATTSTK